MTNYISKKVKNNVNLNDLYSKSNKPTNKLLENTPKECLKLREKNSKGTQKSFQRKTRTARSNKSSTSQIENQ